MAILIFGLILLAAPFVLMDFFSDKKIGFIYILFFLLLFQSILGILIQATGTFYYYVIVAATILADILVFFVYFKKVLKGKKRSSFSFINIDWMIIIVAIISILSLYQVHYNYTGKINLATDQSVSYHSIKNMTYPYPYFSDEWYAVSLVEGAISNHSLPVKNILNGGFFLNLEIFFHSLISQIALLLGLNPLLHYVVLSIFFNALIVLLIYLFLRINNVSRLVAGSCSLFALYITCGANLPGLWQFIPFTSGIIFFLFGMCFMEIGDIKTTVLAVIASSLFYPPLFPFYLTGLITFLFVKTKIPKNRLAKITGYVFLSLFFIVPVLYLLLMISPLAKITNYIFSRIFYVSLMAPLMGHFYFYNIIPLPAILLAVLGMYYVYKNKKWVLLSEFILGLIFWIFYSFTNYRFFPEFERVVILTSIIAVIISGFGLKQLEEYATLKFKKNGKNVLMLSEAALICIFLLLVPVYTQQENWRKIVYNNTNGSMVFPKSPANTYLTSQDLEIFKDIKNKVFLSLPWKGTVIGVATGNYPVLTKEGTISIGSNSTLDNFFDADCQGRIQLAKRRKIDYIYLYKMDCPGFQKINESDEGFILYKTVLNKN